MNDLRRLLRSETRVSHDRVDQLYSTLDLTLEVDYRAFLLSNLTALHGFSLADLSDKVADYVKMTCALLRADLTVLNGEPHTPYITTRGGMAPNAISSLYVFGGANFGQRVLHARWQKSRSKVVRSAGRYLESQSASVLWKEFLAESAKSQITHDDRYIIVNSANQMFDVYAEAFSAVNAQLQPDALVAV